MDEEKPVTRAEAARARARAKTKAQLQAIRRPVHARAIGVTPPRPPAGSVPLGTQLASLIERSGVPVAVAAERAGMPRQQLWRILHGDVLNPGILTIQTVVRGIDLEMHDLFADGPLIPGGVKPRKKPGGVKRPE